MIALTHMRVPNDHRLAQEASGIDLILGGHDHHYEVKEVGNVDGLITQVYFLRNSPPLSYPQNKEKTKKIIIQNRKMNFINF